MELLIAEEGTQLLPWATRIKVAIGAALGLTFLHDDSNQQIIYRDFKASNRLGMLIKYQHCQVTKCVVINKLLLALIYFILIPSSFFTALK
jgi:hypothetical protein